MRQVYRAIPAHSLANFNFSSAFLRLLPFVPYSNREVIFEETIGFLAITILSPSTDFYLCPFLVTYRLATFLPIYHYQAHRLEILRF